MEKEGLKLLSAEITNFKNIAHKKVIFDGKSAIVIGKNKAGKSSFLQAIMSPVDAKVIPDKAIKNGETRASIELEIGGVMGDEKVRYDLGMYFSPEHQKGRLSLSNDEEGQMPSTKTAISDLVGNIGFDIMEFIRMGQTKDGRSSKPGIRDQIEVLKALMPIESVKELYSLDKEKKDTYDGRADINKELKYHKSLLEGHEYSQEDIEKYSEAIDSSDVKEKMANLSSAVEKHAGVESKLESKRASSISLEAKIASLENELKKAKEDKANVDMEISKGEAWLEKNNKPDITELSKKLEEINEHNEICSEIKKLESTRNKIDSIKEQSESMTQRLKDIEDEKKHIFSESPLPVKGLEFDDEQILFQGLPLNDKQINTSTLIGIGCRIGMAMNPKLRLMIINDGSLLDKETLKFILKTCEDNGYQLLIEMVDQDGGDLSIEFTEDKIK